MGRKDDKDRGTVDHPDWRGEDGFASGLDCKVIDVESPIQRITTRTTNYGWVDWIKFEGEDWEAGLYDWDENKKNERTWTFTDED